MAVSLTATQFKSLILSMGGSALSYVANSYIDMAVDDFCLLPALLCNKVTNIQT